MLSHQSYVRSWRRHLTMLWRNSIAMVIGKGMGPLEAAEVLKMLEGTANLLWQLLFPLF